MDIKIIKESDVIERQSEKRQECACPRIENHLNIISAEKIIKCERAEIGLIHNCALCEGASKEMFRMCKNKWADY
jgi:hypothetical protein